MKFTNQEMFENIELLSGLNEKGKVGYAIARNLRKLKEECTEYLNTRTEAFSKYGTVIDKDKGIVNISADILEREIKDIKDIEHNVDIYKVDEETFINGNLTSSQMEKLLWMIED